MIIKRVGFACKFSEVDNRGEVTSIPDLNTGSTTVAWLNRQSKDVAEQRLWDLMVRNIEAIRKLVDRVGQLAPHLRMVRLGSDILPVYTHSDWSYFWQRTDVVSYIELNFAVVGNIARSNDVRLSFHPGQFVVLASIDPGIVERSIEEFEYHANMARWMGYGKSFQDFKINVHISGRLGPDGIRAAYKCLSVEARNCITIENEENSWGLADCLTIGDLVPIVLDVHHHFIREGEYIEAADSRVQQVIDSWRGVRPTFHFSQSREDYLNPEIHTTKTKMSVLLEQGYRKQKLRAHSDFYWNNEINEWALTHLQWGDMMAESKGKNLASFALAKQARDANLV